ncbi:hypothetical protein BDW59DRAFT_105606 [Aspergillus cavernicola]|uniref:Transmembrane protein n=1 Tax=Aspergillus cavernicola TaxID=176166 RepID=A0ABR4IXV0_9EURO
MKMGFVKRVYVTLVGVGVGVLVRWNVMLTRYSDSFLGGGGADVVDCELFADCHVEREFTFIFFSWMDLIVQVVQVCWAGGGRSLKSVVGFVSAGVESRVVVPGVLGADDGYAVGGLRLEFGG